MQTQCLLFKPVCPYGISFHTKRDQYTSQYGIILLIGTPPPGSQILGKPNMVKISGVRYVGSCWISSMNRIHEVI